MERIWLKYVEHIFRGLGDHNSIQMLVKSGISEVVAWTSSSSLSINFTFWKLLQINNILCFKSWHLKSLWTKWFDSIKVSFFIHRIYQIKQQVSFNESYSCTFEISFFNAKYFDILHDIAMPFLRANLFTRDQLSLKT